jgi:tetratricopeptide (TPR) repeat protein
MDSAAGLKEREKPFEIAASLGKLYFGQGRYAEAREFFQQAALRVAPARALYASLEKSLKGKSLPSRQEAGCDGDGATLEMLSTRATELAKARKALAAAVCAKAAMVMAMEAEVLLGHAMFLTKRPQEALEAYERVLAIVGGDVEARYSRAALLLDFKSNDVSALKLAASDLDFVVASPAFPPGKLAQAKRFQALARDAVVAGGISKVSVLPAQVTPPSLAPEVVAAFQNAPRTADQEAEWSRLMDQAEEYLAKGQFQQALDSYKQVMPYLPDNPRVRAGMAWTMIRLNRQPMADNVWRVATQTPDAVATLGDVLKSKGDADGAKALWQKLRETAPTYAPKLQGRE